MCAEVQQDIGFSGTDAVSEFGTRADFDDRGGEIDVLQKTEIVHPADIKFVPKFRQFRERREGILSELIAGQLMGRITLHERRFITQQGFEPDVVSAAEMSQGLPDGPLTDRKARMELFFSQFTSEAKELLTGPHLVLNQALQKVERGHADFSLA